MKNEKKIYNVHIFDDHYNLVSDESERLVAESASLIDSLMREIAENSTVANPKRVAVLAALRIASDLIRIKGEVKQRSREEEELVEVIDRILATSSSSVSP